MGLLYAENGKIYANEHLELYVPASYFDNGIAKNMGASMESFGVLYVRGYIVGQPGEIQLFNCPVIQTFMVYETRFDTIIVHGKKVDCLVLEYPKGSYIIHQTLPKGREVANRFLDTVLAGKLPNTLNYTDTLDLWWTNLEISGISYKVPSKIYEMILASIYRNPHNIKERYGQLYGKQTNPTGYDYKTEAVRAVVKDLSTFSGMIFEDIGTMISNGINNSITGVEENESPLEKIIHY